LRLLIQNQRIGCPENCVYKAVDPEECKRCRPAKEAQEEQLPWAIHIIKIWEYKQAGAMFLLDDLTLAEWQGLLLFEQEFQKNKQKNQ